MLIDFHTHCFPARIAGAAMEKLSYSGGNILPYADGTVEGTAKHMRDCGVDYFVVLSIATNAHQQKSVNDFAASINNQNGAISFGSVYPYAEDAVAEVERIADMGMKGVKFHPEYQQFDPDDSIMWPIYRKISDLGLIVTFHAGMDIGCMPPYRGMPEKLRRAASRMDVPVICAHWGAAGYGEETLKWLCDAENIYVDTSYGYAAGPRPLYQKIAEKRGTDHVLFASDCPWHSPAQELRLLDSLGLTEAEKEDIRWRNAAGLLKLDI